MKKITALLLCILMLASLASCRGTDEPAETTVATTAQELDGGAGGATKSHTIILSNKERARLAIDKVVAGERPMIKQGAECYIYDWEIYDLNNVEYSYVNVDMDKDGIDEIIIKAKTNYNTNKLLLHYEDDTVYGFLFDDDAMMCIYPDGSFEWYYSSYGEQGYGHSTLSFDNGNLKFTELCRCEKSTRFYIDGKEVTQEKYYEYTTATFISTLTFAPLDTSKWGSGRAIALAEAYWGVEHGGFEEETGYRYKLTSRIYGEKTGDHGYYDYLVCLYKFVNNSYYEHVKCVRVNTDTGEILDEFDSDYHGKG